MWRAHQAGDHAGRQRRAARKDLRMNLVWMHAPGGQAHHQVAEEARWPAEIEVAISRDAQILDDLHPQTTSRVVVLPYPIVRIRSTVPDVTSPASKQSQDLPHLRGK
jgi:hypothetical protein